jgi:hypothetical protein
MNTSELITKTSDFDPTEVAYKEPRLNKRGGKNIALTKGGNPLVLQFPLIFTWGVNERVAEESGRVSYDLNLSFTSKDSTDPVGEFYNKLKELQEKVLDDAVENSKLWFGKAKMSREVALAMMYPILKFPKDKNTGEPDETRPATVKLKLPFWENKFNLELYNMKRQPLFVPNEVEDNGLPMDLVPARSYVKGLMQCSGVWFAGGRFGVTWNLLQAQVRRPVRIKGFCMLDDSGDEATLAKVEAEEAVEAAVGEVFDAEMAEEESPKKKIRKKVVRKKKSKAVV